MIFQEMCCIIVRDVLNQSFFFVLMVDTSLCVHSVYYYLLFSDFVQSTRYIKQKDTSPLQGFST